MKICTNFVTVFVILICGHYSVESSPDADAVRFPDSNTFRSILPCPNGQNFCDGINDYPSNVNVDGSLLSNNLIRKKIFDDKFKNLNRINQISTRNFDQEKRACPFERSVVYPRKARNVKGQFVFIVNDSKYRQAVEIEQCKGEGQKCLTDSDAPYSEKTVCKQKYATYKLYAITSNREQVYDSFSLPSACLCHYKSPSSFRSSISVSTRTRRNRKNLPFCKAGTKLNIQNPYQQVTIVQNNQYYKQTSRPNSEFQQFQTNIQPLQQFQTNVQPQGGRTSISGRPPSQQRPSNGFRPISENQMARLNRGLNQNRRSGQRRNGNQRRNRRNHQSRNPNIQTQNRSYRWRRDTRRIDCDNPQSTFCQSPRNYPSDSELRLLINNADVSGEAFKQVFDGQCTSNIATRGFAIDEEQLCSGTQNVIFPRKAMNMDNKWRFVVNIDNFTQSIEVEECDNSFGFSQGSSDEFGVCLYSGSQGNNPGLTSCKQVYTEHKLLALTEAGQLEVDRFMLPSACACYFKGNLGNFDLQL